MHNEIDAWIDAHADDVLETARALVRIPTINHPPEGNEEQGQRFVQDLLAGLGAELDVFTPDDVDGLKEHPAYHPDSNGKQRQFANRPDVVGTWRGSGGRPSVLFSTHIDTVPVGPTPWREGTAFGGEIKEGRLYGRGSYDTKCALASHVHAVRCLRELGSELRGNVIIESVVDEEYGGSHGVLAARLRGHNADIAFNSEPTHLVVCPAHRGGREAYLRFRGDAGMVFHQEKHSDPVLALGHAITAIKAFDRARNRETVPALYQSDPVLPFYLNQVGGGGTTYEEATGTPEETYLHFWAEVYEGTTAEQFDSALLAEIQRALDADPDCAGMRPELRPTTRFLPGSSMPLDHPALDVLREVYAGQNRAFEMAGAPFACDGYVFNLYSPTPALILGPGGGNAHAADEFVLTEDLLSLTKICAHFIQRWCC